MAPQDKIGKRFGLLTVLKKAENDKWGHFQWDCECDCGNRKIVKTGDLGSRIKSCGCLSHAKGKACHSWKGGRIEVPCANPECNKIKLMYPSRKKLYEKFYCSVKCSGAHRLGGMTGDKHPKYKERVKVKCAYCDKPIEIAPCIKRLYKNHFCKGSDCQSKWNSENRKGKANSNYRGGTPERRKIRCRMAANMRKAIKQKKAGRHWEELVDYGLEDLIKRLKATIPNGYSWENDFVNGNNILHIDHIIPMAVFNFNSPDHADFKRCFALDNLQLLPALENEQKSAKLFKHFQPSLQMELNL